MLIGMRKEKLFYQKKNGVKLLSFLKDIINLEKQVRENDYNN